METFLTPNTDATVLWGVGPMAVIPTASADVLGSGQWDLGPAAVGVVMRGPWVFGALITQAWSLGGEGGRRSTAPFNLQPFVNYNLPYGWAISTAPTFSADWNAGDHNAWTAPIGGSISRTIIVAKQPLSLAAAACYNLDKPEYQADWQVRLVLTLMFPEN